MGGRFNIRMSAEVDVDISVFFYFCLGVNEIVRWAVVSIDVYINLVVDVHVVLLSCLWCH